MYSHVLPRQQFEAASAFAALVDEGRSSKPAAGTVTECPGCGYDGVKWEAR
jgi:hypothetical protein